METDLIKVVIIGMVSMFLIIMLKNVKNEYAFIIGLAASIIIFSFVVIKLGTIKKAIDSFSGYIAMDSKYIGILLKMTGITYVAEFCASICKDAGNQTIASQIEIYARITLLALSLPVITALIETINNAI